MIDVPLVYDVGALGTVLLPAWLVWWRLDLLRRPQ
jgi:hypothetical protein